MRQVFGACLLLLAFSSAWAARISLTQDQTARLAQALSGPARRVLGNQEHSFKPGDKVPLWASKVGPFSNPRCVGAVELVGQTAYSNGVLHALASSCWALLTRSPFFSPVARL